jgi:translation initiation factor IF-3
VATDNPRVNQHIRARQVRLIGADGEQLGVVSIKEALAIAAEQELDVVEVSPKSDPPVCKLMDYGKYKYRQSKRARKAKSKQHVVHVKEIKLRPKISEHDYTFKMKHARRFLEDRDKVKVTVIFRGREMAHQDLGRNLMEKFAQDVSDVSFLETPLKQEGRNLVMILAPKQK